MNKPKGIIVIELPEVPEDCYHCNQKDGAYGYCEHVGKFIDHFVKPGERHPLCPIREMPEEDEEIDKSCRFCKYGDGGEDEYPCIQCTERYSNQFEPKPKKPELKPCPFCGKDAQMCHTGREHHHVQCVGCACHTMSYETPIEAIEVWNRRV